MKPLLLDLFAGEGGATCGYQRAGWQVIAVDINPKALARNPAEVKWEADALEHLAEAVERFYPFNYVDAIHASPPCQAYSVATRDKSGHPDLVGRVRELLRMAEVPYVIENVPGAPLIDPVVICGSSLGLKVRRHRLFETNWPLMVPPCAHGQQGQPVGVYGEGSSKGQKRGKKASSEAEVLEVMGMPWATRRGATQAIPPAYTELIGAQLLDHLRVKAEAA